MPVYYNQSVKLWSTCKEVIDIMPVLQNMYVAIKHTEEKDEHKC